MRKFDPHIIIWELEIYIPDWEDAFERKYFLSYKRAKKFIETYGDSVYGEISKDWSYRLGGEPLWLW